MHRVIAQLLVALGIAGGEHFSPSNSTILPFLKLSAVLPSNSTVASLGGLGAERWLLRITFFNSATLLPS